MNDSKSKNPMIRAGIYNKEMSLYSFIFHMIKEGINKTTNKLRISTNMPIIMTQKSAKMNT